MKIAIVKKLQYNNSNFKYFSNKMYLSEKITHKLNNVKKILFQKSSLTIIAVIFLGIFLRTYHFSSGLLFEIDQSYDTRIVSNAVEQGIGNLPLLGPTAGGGRALRLGPAFYYMQYASAKIFGNKPVGHAMLVLIFSILAIPLFYFFCRNYFSEKISLPLLALFSASFFMIVYGRFSWSPNVLPFLIIATFYALLKSIHAEKNKECWFLLTVFLISVTSQIHFNSFFTIPTISFLFLAYKRPRFKLKIWLLAIGIVLLAYSPMILNDFKTNGENIGFFLKKISKGGSPQKNIFQKTALDLNYISSEFLFINTAADHVNGKRLVGTGFKNDANLKWHIIAILIFLIEIFFLVFNFFKEKNSLRKDFLLIVLLWIILPFLYFYSLLSGNFHMYPRFFLLLAPLPFILLGILFEKMLTLNKRIGFLVVSMLSIFLLFLNLSETKNYFSFINGKIPKDAEVAREDVFPNTNRLTLKEQLAITNYIKSIAVINNYPVFISTYGEYEPIFWYHLSRLGINYTDKFDAKNATSKGNYFLIKYFNIGTREINNEFEIMNKKNFGVLTVYTLKPLSTMQNSQSSSPKKLLQTIQIEELIKWKDLLTKK